MLGRAPTSQSAFFASSCAYIRTEANVAYQESRAAAMLAGFE
jgi:hypothetical protein